MGADDGVLGALRGLWHAHVGWLFASQKSEPQRWAPDLLKDRDLVRINAAFPLLVVASLVLPAVIGGAVSRSWAGAADAFVWGALARIFVLHHVTWSVNSICHFFGKRPFNNTDESTNNWPLAILSFGESWHNNHHAFPSAAVHGIERAQVDVSGGLIVLLEKAGLARNVKRVTSKQLLTKRAGGVGA